MKSVDDTTQADGRHVRILSRLHQVSDRWAESRFEGYEDIKSSRQGGSADCEIGTEEEGKGKRVVTFYRSIEKNLSWKTKSING
jgi:hypothetical protein